METTPQPPAAARLREVQSHINAAAQAAGRSADDVHLVAISKGHTAEEVEAFIALGITCFGENRVQEAEAKFAGKTGLELHLTGPLQTNKVKQALALFDVIQTIDRPELIAAIARAMATSTRYPRLFIQVNIGQEPQKAGVHPQGLNNLLSLASRLGLQIDGLMCIPPLGQDPTPFFKDLARLALEHGLPELSMGMSGDYTQAIACGATYIRVGTALFGARSHP